MGEPLEQREITSCSSGDCPFAGDWYEGNHFCSELGEMVVPVGDHDAPPENCPMRKKLIVLYIDAED